MKNLEELSYDVETEWKREAEAMKDINRLGHRHITCALAAFKQNQKYYLILEWADGGNLRDFWAANRHPQLTKVKVKEFIGQLWGLADALDQIHNSNKPELLRIRTESTSQVTSGTDFSSRIPGIQLNGVESLHDEQVASEVANDQMDNGKVKLQDFFKNLI
jgi:serine/threonine protein kinase